MLASGALTYYEERREFFSLFFYARFFKLLYTLNHREHICLTKILCDILSRMSIADRNKAGSGRRYMKTRVKELRTAAKMTQQQLADLVHVSSRTIISIEKEQYSPSLMLAYRIAQVFGVTVEELCCLKENKELEDKRYENL